MSDFLKRALEKASAREKEKNIKLGNSTDNTDTMESLVQGNSAIAFHRAQLALRKEGWIEIKSSVFETNLYIIRDQSIETPDSSLPRFTLKEVEALKGLAKGAKLEPYELEDIENGVAQFRRGGDGYKREIL